MAGGRGGGPRAGRDHTNNKKKEEVWQGTYKGIYKVFTKGLQRDPFGTTREVAVIFHARAIQYF